MSNRPKKLSPPKPRHVWGIHPKTRVKPSEKTYRRPREKKKAQSWIDKIDWFGE